MKINILCQALSLKLSLEAGSPLHITGTHPEIATTAIDRMMDIVGLPQDEMSEASHRVIPYDIHSSRIQAAVVTDEVDYFVETNFREIAWEELKGLYRRHYTTLEFRSGFKGPKRHLQKYPLRRSTTLVNATQCNAGVKNPILLTFLKAVRVSNMDRCTVNPVQAQEHLATINTLLSTVGRAVLTWTSAPDNRVKDIFYEVCPVRGGLFEPTGIRFGYRYGMTDRTDATIRAILTMLDKSNIKILNLDTVYPELREAILALNPQAHVVFQCGTPMPNYRAVPTNIVDGKFVCE